jgi:hypothetical protein
VVVAAAGAESGCAGLERLAHERRIAAMSSAPAAA